jgi:site-specific recombinase XerD
MNVINNLQALTDHDSDISVEYHTSKFIQSIVEQGYKRGTVTAYRSRAMKLCSLMADRQMTTIDLDEKTASALIDEIVMGFAKGKQSHYRYCLQRFRDYLIDHAAAPPRPEAPVDPSPRACLRREYQKYLEEQRGLSDSTVYACLGYFDRFLTFKFGESLGDIRQITADDVTSFLLRLRAPDAAPRNRTIPTHLRTLFNFLFWSGKTTQDLAKVIPRVKTLKTTKIPRYLAIEDVNKLLAAAHDGGNNGRRNYAMLLVMARMGLRAPEVVAIQLDDIHWRMGELIVRGKGKLNDRMPIPIDVGEAIVDYIRNERIGNERTLFVSSRAPYRRFKGGQILRSILQKAYDTTGIAPPQSSVGSHILRHSLATDMLQNGASLQEIGELLRHRSRMTTTIYAQHDLDALRSIARPWPTSEVAQ